MPRISSKALRVPEAASRPNTAISASLPPSSDQLVISPVKILAICSLVSSATGFSGFTTTATPSLAMTFATAPSPSSSSESSRLERPRSQLPARTPSMPALEPEPV